MALTRIKQSGLQITTEPVYLDDISNQFDGTKSVFNLTVDTALVSNVINRSVVDSKDLEVVVNGLLVKPFVKDAVSAWGNNFSNQNGFKVVGDTIVFYSAPGPGSQCTIIIRNNSQTIQQRRYPIRASIVALGD